ncbi:MAG: hypothetical protein MKZ95_10295, partial [Pirellulales bacterium]|nr:hypothetical protein [Pirellulales bacterium]
FLWLLALWAKVWDRVLGRERAVAVPETMSRLRSRKQEIGEQIESRRDKARFVVPPETEESAQAVSPAGPSDPVAKRPESRAPDEKPEIAAEPSYTERLLKAKRQVWDDQQQKKKKDDPRE